MAQTEKTEKMVTDGANGTDGEHGHEHAAEDQRVLTRPLMVVIEDVPALSK